MFFFLLLYFCRFVCCRRRRRSRCRPRPRCCCYRCRCLYTHHIFWTTILSAFTASHCFVGSYCCCYFFFFRRLIFEWGRRQSFLYYLIFIFQIFFSSSSVDSNYQKIRKECELRKIKMKKQKKKLRVGQLSVWTANVFFFISFFACTISRRDSSFIIHIKFNCPVHLCFSFLGKKIGEEIPSYFITLIKWYIFGREMNLFFFGFVVTGIIERISVWSLCPLNLKENWSLK